MSGNMSGRQKAITVIKNWQRADRPEILKAIFDLRHNAMSGDESILYPLLNGRDDGIVASVIYSLFEVYSQETELYPIIRRLAWGDARDREDMPIQTTAITLLARLAKFDLSAYHQLIKIAEDSDVSDIPRKRAWHCLADLNDISWLSEYTDEMIMFPKSDKSESIRELIRQAIARIHK